MEVVTNKQKMKTLRKCLECYDSSLELIKNNIEFLDLDCATESNLVLDFVMSSRKPLEELLVINEVLKLKMTGEFSNEQ